MAVNIQMEKNDNENNAALLRRFKRAVQGSKLIPHIRETRFHKRDLSGNIIRTKKIKQLKKSEEITRLIKLGKMPEKKTMRR
jgi:ribosomal protein S21